MPTERTDRFTGKPIPETRSRLAETIDETCDECGTQLINRCLTCGAPVCCPKCCDEAMRKEARDAD